MEEEEREEDDEDEQDSASQKPGTTDSVTHIRKQRVICYMLLEPFSVYFYLFTIRLVVSG